MKEKKNANGQVRFPGEKLVIGDHEFVVPPLSFRQLEEHDETLRKFMKIGDSIEDAMSGLRDALPIIHAAISRNYEITIDELAEIVDMGNYRKVIEAIMGVAGIGEELLRRKASANATGLPGVVPPGARGEVKPVPVQ